jgi:non-canonical purine NTP pyrophosphatase (RdgB/HAM1 family)
MNIIILAERVDMKKIYYATSNPGKFEEVERYVKLKTLPIHLEQYAGELDELQTYDQRSIAIAKAKQAWDILQRPVLVDDSGIYFEQYHQFPGVFSKFVYYGIGFEGIFKLVNPGDRAYFLLYLVYAYGPDRYQLFEVRHGGTIIKPESIDVDFKLPYLYMIIPDGAAVSYAQLRAEGKDHEFNFRIQAFKRFLVWLEAT